MICIAVALNFCTALLTGKIFSRAGKLFHAQVTFFSKMLAVILSKALERDEPS